MELICPDCLMYLVSDDVIDYDIGIDYADVKEIGHCPKCNKHFQWYTHFKFSCYEDLIEI
jgi:hypothetical protein